VLDLWLLAAKPLDAAGKGDRGFHRRGPLWGPFSSQPASRLLTFLDIPLLSVLVWRMRCESLALLWL
jgi:hypothetical protein